MSLSGFTFWSEVWRKNQQAQTKEIMPEVEIQIEQFRDRWYGECWIDWNDGPPQYRLISGDQETVVETCDRIRRFVMSIPPEPALTIDYFGGA